MTAFNDRLRTALDGGAASDDWKPPVGNYTVEIQDGAAWTAQSSGKDTAKVELKIVGGDYAGRAFDHILGLEGKAFDFSVTALSTYGVDFRREYADLAEFSQAIAGLKGRLAEVSVSQSGVYTNVNVGSSRPPDAQQALALDTPAQQPVNATGGMDDPAEDDIPF